MSQVLEKHLEIVLIGPQNVGKTTLFNALTDQSCATANYAGSTVSNKACHLRAALAMNASVVDTPGITSLEGSSPEQLETLQYLKEFKERVYVVVVDATQLGRHLCLVEDLASRDLPMILVVTMCDRLKGSLDGEILEKYQGVPCLVLDPRETSSAEYLCRALQKLEPKESCVLASRFEPELLKARFDKAEMLEKLVAKNEEKPSWDHWLMHPVWGLALFLSVMALWFSAIFWLAAPLMEIVDDSTSFLIKGAREALPRNAFTEIFTAGILPGIQAVLVFVPQIASLFFLMGYLEGSGYMARGAALLDRPLSMIGLGGRSFAPLMTGFACAIPAVMATRSIKSYKERWLTIFILPLMACSARLPVFALLISFLFPTKWGGVALLGLYLASILVGAVVSKILSHYVSLSNEGGLLLELPKLQLPRLKAVMRATGRSVKKYLVDAGPTIIAISALLSIATHFPLQEDRQNSYAAKVGKVLEPALEPMGLDWRGGVSLITGFAAREVFVSSLAVMYRTDEDHLLEKMRQAEFDSEPGKKVFTKASAAALLFFFLFALQCFPTMVITAKELGTWRTPILQLFLYTGIAYLGAVVIFQTLS